MAACRWSAFGDSTPSGTSSASSRLRLGPDILLVLVIRFALLEVVGRGGGVGFCCVDVQTLFG